MGGRSLLALLAALALLFPGSARAEERILHFLSDVAVQRDGSLEVTETIRVRAEGENIRRGILRDFPTRYEGRGGRDHFVGFEPLSVTRNGMPEPWTTERLSNGVRIRVGNADVLLPTGEHAYAIRYRTTRQLGYFGGYDELYWNATGTGWPFAIDVAESRVRLPSPATFGQRTFYTGPQGARGTDARLVEERPGEILFRTTRPLEANSGLTIAVAWPKNIVETPGSGSEARWWLQDQGPWAAAILGLLGICGYYFHAWRKAGRGPRAGTVVPIFAPPDDLSPAALRYIAQMGFDDRAFAAAIVDLGVKGRIRLEEQDGGFFSSRKTYIHRTGTSEGLPAPEAAMLDRLFLEGDSLLADDKHHKIFGEARTKLRKGLEAAYEGKLIRRNWAWSLAGLIALALAMGLVGWVLILGDPSGYPAQIPFLAPLGVGALAAAYGLHASYKSFTGTLLSVVLGLIGLAALFVTVGHAFESGRVVPLLLPLLAIPLVISAFVWMAAPTREGRRIMDRIAGFRQYLSITEEERLQAMHPPEKTPELFERFLPHAIALKVENRWADRFATVLASAAVTPGQQPMRWYSGRSDPWRDPGDFAETVGSSLSSTVASASTAPGSSGGSGGGGSSGGGGGGGGGGGW